MNIQIAEQTIKQLVLSGVHSFCFCPGGRLAPFVEVLSHSKGIECLSFFEERSAGFFALGRVRRDEKPVAVLTTSGTAVAELLPAVIEAHYSSLPLVLVTADRPLEFGRKGSPQTLKNAIQILENYCHTFKHILDLEDVHFSNWNSSKGSLHLNVCFDEPLIDEQVSVFDFSSLKRKNTISIYPSTELFFSVNKETEENSYEDSGFSEKHKATLGKNINLQKICKKEIEIFFKNCKKPLLLVGELKRQEQSVVQDILTHYKGLFYTEPLSGLESMPQRLLSGEKILNYASEKNEVDGVIRLGGIPRVRFWRDLEKKSLPVLSLSSPPFYAGLSRSSVNLPLLDSINLLKSHLLSLREFGDSLKDFDQVQLQKWKSVLENHPQSEEFWFWTLKQSLKEKSKVFLGNSSPIRLWDKVAFCKKAGLCITGQAGVNGIDGLVSRFLGECDPEMNNVGILGDLSLLYDMAGFWKGGSLSSWTLIVINNFGGQIFSRLFNNPAFLNQHKLSFDSLAEMWGLTYQLCKEPKDFSRKANLNFVEIRPKAEDTEACFKKYVSLWDSL